LAAVNTKFMQEVLPIPCSSDNQFHAIDHDLSIPVLNSEMEFSLATYSIPFQHRQMSCSSRDHARVLALPVRLGSFPGVKLRSTATRISTSARVESSVFGPTRIHPRFSPDRIGAPSLDGVTTNGVGVVVLHARQHARGIVVEQLCVHLLPPIGNRPATHQERWIAVTISSQVLERRDRRVT
jgi:hypothetical protein